jgi:tetratricopeptide (TPR) repeat protein
MSSDARKLGLKPGNAVYFYNEALEHHKAGRFDQAQNAARLACECDAFMTVAWELRGLALAQFYEFQGAADCLRRATELEPKRVSAWANLGEVCLKLYLYPEAEKALKTAISLDPKALDPASRRARLVILTRNLWGQT